MLLMVVVVYLFCFTGRYLLTFSATGMKFLEPRELMEGTRKELSSQMRIVFICPPDKLMIVFIKAIKMELGWGSDLTLNQFQSTNHARL